MPALSLASQTLPPTPSKFCPDLFKGVSQPYEATRAKDVGKTTKGLRSRMALQAFSFAQEKSLGEESAGTMATVRCKCGLTKVFWPAGWARVAMLSPSCTGVSAATPGRGVVWPKAVSRHQSSVTSPLWIRKIDWPRKSALTWTTRPGNGAGMRVAGGRERWQPALSRNQQISNPSWGVGRSFCLPHHCWLAWGSMPGWKSQ